MRFGFRGAASAGLGKSGKRYGLAGAETLKVW